MPNFTPSVQRLGYRTPILKFLLRFDQNVEYKRPAAVYPLRNIQRVAPVGRKPSKLASVYRRFALRGMLPVKTVGTKKNNLFCSCQTWLIIFHIMNCNLIKMNVTKNTNYMPNYSHLHICSLHPLYTIHYIVCCFNVKCILISTSFCHLCYPLWI